MATVTCTSSNVKIQKGGSLAGSCTITGNQNGISSTLATISASGSPPSNSSEFDAGSNSGWTLDVSYNGTTATGTASGVWADGSWSPNVPVSVDHPGRSRHHPSAKPKRKAAKARRSSKPRKARAKPSKSRKTAVRSKPSAKRKGARKTRGLRRR